MLKTRVWVTLLIPYILAVFAVSVAVGAEPSTSAKDEEIAYLLDGFENTMPGVWRGRPEAGGGPESESRLVHDGSQAARLNWDFTRCPDGNMSFVNFLFHRELVGRPKAVRFWMYAEKAMQGTRLVLWIGDNSEEIYVTHQQVNWEGWKQITMPIATDPAWISGDKNRKHDYPLQLFGLAIDFGGPKTGWVVVDQVEIITLAKPREALIASVGSDQPFNIFWKDQPLIVGSVQSYSTAPVTDLTFDVTVTDTYYGREIRKGKIAIPRVGAKGTARGELGIQVPYGLYRVDWTLSDKEGVIRKSSSEVTRMLPKCYQGLSQAAQMYAMYGCPFGGVFWQCTPEQGSDTGARWIRNSVPWWTVESKPGTYEFAAARKLAKDFFDTGIESIWFSTLYEAPTFYQQDKTDYAAAYGAYHRELARALQGMVDKFECGNEDNGPTKMLYTEVARHGSAGVRSASPFTLVANSGTAFCDVGWLQMQADRGLYDWVDALCTHPYTTTASPEKWGVFEQTRKVVELNDELGGMKNLWTTEFGWPVEVDEKNHTDWVVRHFLIGVAGGYEKHGLYAWDGHFGIYDNGRPFLAAVSTHTMCKILEGYRFAGILKSTKDVWAVVWEKFGEPVVVAWSPTGKNVQESLPAGEAKIEVRDVMGNVVPSQPAKGGLSLNLGSAPQYVLYGPTALTRMAWDSQLGDLLTRFTTHLNKTSLKNEKIPTDLPTTQLLQEMKRLEKSHPNVPRRELRGIQANLLRIAVLRCRMGLVETEKSVGVDEFVKKAAGAMTAAHDRDLDMPDLRWAVNRVQELDLERKFAESEQASEYAKRLVAAQSVLVRFAEAFLMNTDAASFTAVWPYLYTLDKDGKTLRERLAFVPGVARDVNVRINSYARNGYDGELSLQLPAGWKCEPATQTIKIPAGKHVETTCRITASTSPVQTPKIHARLTIPGKPIVTVPFDDIEIVPVIRVTQETLPGLLPATPLTFKLTNQDTKIQKGSIRLFLDKGSSPVAQTQFAELNPNAETVVKMSLPATLKAPEFSEWPLITEVALADGNTTRQAIAPDFACAVHADKAPAIDGDLSDWKDAAPLHLNKAEYAKGSYGLNWNPEDLSGTCYLKWDEKNIYFAARVSDQTFNQNLHGQSIWSQDSIQLAFARTEKGPSTELGLALTPQGEEVYRFTGDTDVTDAKMKVVVSQGLIVYEAAIPWSALAGIGPIAAGTSLRFSILLNDDDAVIPRRFLERFGGIAHGKNIAEFGHLMLLKGK